MKDLLKYYVLVALFAGIISGVQAQCPTGATTIRTSTDVTCFGANDGTITVELADGAAPINFELYDNFLGTFVTPTVTRTIGPFNRVVFSNVPPSIYQVVVFKTGCTTRVVIEPPFGFEITEPTALTASSTFLPDCNTNPLVGNGSINLTVSGGTSPYSFLWNDGATSEDRINLNAGTYSVTIRDANNCTFPVSVTIPVPTVASAGPDQNLCINSTTLSGSVPGAGESGQWTLISGSGTITDSTNPTTTVTSLGFGTNTFRWTITTTIGPCPTRQDEVSIIVPPTLTANATKTDVSCFGGLNGSINVTVSGGTAPYTFVWSDGPVTTEDRTGLGSGSYTVTVRDTRGCQTIATVSITQPTELLLSTAQVNLLCFGVNTGSIDLTVTGGTPGYTYVWSNGATSQDISGLAAGTYSVNVTDVNGCAKSTSVTITTPSAITISTTKTDVSCHLGNNGSITVTPGGGTPGYEFSRNNGVTFQTSPIFTGLLAGTYAIRIRDLNGCVSSPLNVTITQPAAPVSFTSSSTGVLCFGDANGTITINASGGTPGYQYSNDNGSNFQPGNTFTNLMAGNYNVLVRDANGCTTSSSVVTVGGPTAALVFSTSKVDVLCLGGTNGSISVTASGGTPGYSYSINGGAFQPASIFTSLSANTYSIQVRDANNCTSAIASVTITQPVSSVSFSSITTAVACRGDATGSIVITAVGGTSPYAYSINGGTTFQASNIFIGLTANVYSVVVRDANSCPPATASVSVTQPAAILSFTNSKIDVACLGGATGSITINPSGGTAPYSFSIDNGASFQTSSNVFSGLVAGSYQVLVRDQNLCTTSAVPVIITAPASAVTFSSTVSPVSCFGGANGSITLTPSGGTPGYQYSINGGAFQASNSFTGLSAGVYSIIVRDINLCSTVPANVNVNGPATAVTFTSSTTAVSCFGGADGSISISAIGGTPAYEYSITGPGGYQLGSTFSGLSQGNYTILVRDGNGCDAVNSIVTVAQPSSPLTLSVTKTDIRCFGSTTGEILASASGGTAGYEFSIDGTTFQTSGIFSNLISNSYTVQVRDANNCVTISNVTLTQPVAALAIQTVSSTDAFCLGINDGTITVSSVIGGTPAYRYSIDGTNFQGTNSFTGLASGSYSVVVRDVNDCDSAPSVVTISTGTVLDFTATPTGAVCLGINNGSIALSSETGGTGPYTYSNDNGSSFSATNNFTGLAPGDYQVVIQDALNCRSIAKTVTVAAATVITAAVVATPASCANNDGTIEFTSTSGGMPNYSYSISGPTGTFILNQTLFTDLVSTPGPTGYEAVVRDANGCLSAAQTILVPISNIINLDTLYINRTISLPDRPTGAMVVGLVEEGNSPYQVSLELTESIPLDGKTLSTGLVDAAINPANGNWEASFPDLFPGFYRMTIRNAPGCELIYENVLLLFDTNLLIPNIFTPNGDGVNDVFYVRNKTEFTSVVITNRWGKEVFSSNDYQNDWTGGDASDGVYYYRVKTAGQTFTGWVEILRD
jgi:gliding motility-associated-like protein